MNDEYKYKFYTVSNLSQIGENYKGYNRDVEYIKESVASFIKEVKESVSSTEWNTVYFVQVQIEEVFQQEDGWGIESSCICLEEKLIRDFLFEGNEFGYVNLNDFILT
jgi:hypothetical protein